MQAIQGANRKEKLVFKYNTVCGEACAGHH